MLTPLAVLATFVLQAHGHSWIEQMQEISSDGIFTGQMGYPRGYVARTDAQFSNSIMTNLVPALSTGRTRINDQDLVCSTSQQESNQTAAYPALQASAGNYVAIKYLENGHVTLPSAQLGKPAMSGTVFVYATVSSSANNDMLSSVLQWSIDGKGGNAQGRLLAAQNFDDGRCHQINPGTISQQRQKDFPDRIPGQADSNVEQWCETDVLIPQDFSGQIITLYWIWAWPTQPGMDPTYPDGKDEFYTSCVDVVVKSSSSSATSKLSRRNQVSNDLPRVIPISQSLDLPRVIPIPQSLIFPKVIPIPQSLVLPQVIPIPHSLVLPQVHPISSSVSLPQVIPVEITHSSSLSLSSSPPSPVSNSPAFPSIWSLLLNNAQITPSVPAPSPTSSHAPSYTLLQQDPQSKAVQNYNHRTAVVSNPFEFPGMSTSVLKSTTSSIPFLSSLSNQLKNIISLDTSTTIDLTSSIQQTSTVTTTTFSTVTRTTTSSTNTSTLTINANESEVDLPRVVIPVTFTSTVKALSTITVLETVTVIGK